MPPVKLFVLPVLSPVVLLITIALGASIVAVQVWVGAKQKELGVGSMQLLHQSTPQSSLMLLGAVLVMEQPLMTTTGGPLGFDYTFAAVATIIVSALLGLAVSLSTFLVIGATSSLTYNVVGHIKTTIIIGGGLVLFDDTLPPAKVGPPSLTCLLPVAIE